MSRHASRLDLAQSSIIKWIKLPFLSWMTPILSSGSKLSLNEIDLDDLPMNDRCSMVFDRLNRTDEQWPGTWTILRKTFSRDFLLSIILVLPLVVAHLSQPMAIRFIILYMKNELVLPTYAGYLLAFGLFIVVVLQATVHQQIFFHNARIGMRIRNALSSVIYQNLLRTNLIELYRTNSAQIINLIANDVSKFEELSAFVHTLLLVPMETCGAFLVIWWIIGLPTVFGFSVLLLIVPIQIYFSRKFTQYRRITMVDTDKRLQMINEILNGCQVIKMYLWENAMEERVLNIRREETRHIRKANILRSFNTAISYSTLPLVCLATFGGSWLLNKTLVAEEIFTTLAFFVMVRVPVTITMPNAIEKLSAARISAVRIDRFMRLQRFVTQKLTKAQTVNETNALSFENASFSWSDSDQATLVSINLTVERGQLIGITGSVGAGKSSLLLAILGEINRIDGKYQCFVNSFAYIPQTAWILNDTIRGNILLGKPMNEVRYHHVLRACCLDLDLQSFGEIGDLLVVGDKGCNLSGGQKARISLARALYTDADVYLFDDPFASVDPDVARKIFDRCIGPTSMIHSKTRILATHHINYLTSVDKLVNLERGSLVETHLKTVTNDTASNFHDKTDVTDFKSNEPVLNINANELAVSSQSERTSDGSVKLGVWLKLFQSSCLGSCGLILAVIFMFTNQALYDFSNKWLSIWSSRDKQEQRLLLYVYIYVCACFTTFLLALVRINSIFELMLRGANEFQKNFLRGISRSSLEFFETNPRGRIINRASKDQQVLDDLLPLTMIETFQYLLMTLGSIVVIGINNPWVLLILVPLVPAVLWLRRYYMKTSIQMKRLESVTRSPIYTQFSSSLDGLTSIRAFNVEQDSLNEFMKRIDTNARPYFLLFASARWFGLRLDFIASLFTLATSMLIIVFRHQMDPSAAALSINYCLTLTGLFQWAIRQSTEAENFMTSAERIYEYGQLPSESDVNHDENTSSAESLTDWPSDGVIEFDRYTLRYKTNSVAALDNINLSVSSREKLGIIGRTGAGKSSLIQALFRLNHQSTVVGSIFIDKVNISDLSIERLRSALSVIPQTPVLFCASLRYNLDPQGQYTDEQCLQALEAVRLEHLFRNQPNGLLFNIAESGSNLSLGERQLICVARALLKKSRILLIDEATAHIDWNTDNLVQQIIEEQFQDRTILTIAHRPSTVTNSDRIVELEHGRIVRVNVQLQ